MELSFYPQSVPDSVFPLEECEFLMSNVGDVPNSPQKERDVLALEDLDGLTDFDEIASPTSLDPGSPYSLTTLQDMSDQLTDEELRSLPVRDLNKRIRNLPFCEVQKIRKRRRSLKNRGYALNCRKKRQFHKETLEEQKETLNKELEQVNSKLEQTRKERDMYKMKYEQLQHLWNTYCNAAALMTARGGGQRKAAE